MTRANAPELGRTWPDIADRIRWVVDEDQVLVVDEVTQAVTELVGVEAVIWRAIAARLDGRTLIEIVRRGLRVNQNDAEARLRNALGTWLASGLLAASPGGGHG